MEQRCENCRYGTTGVYEGDPCDVCICYDKWEAIPTPNTEDAGKMMSAMDYFQVKRGMFSTMTDFATDYANYVSKIQVVRFGAWCMVNHYTYYAAGKYSDGLGNLYTMDDLIKKWKEDTK